MSHLSIIYIFEFHHNKLIPSFGKMLAGVPKEYIFFKTLVIKSKIKWYCSLISYIC